MHVIFRRLHFGVYVGVLGFRPGRSNLQRSNHRAKPLPDVIRQAKYAIDAKMTPFGRYIMTVEVKQWRKQLSNNEILKELAVFVNAIEEELAASCLEVRSSASSCT